MSLLGTLAKVAIGIVIAKNIGGVLGAGKPSSPGSGRDYGRGSVGADGRYGGNYSPGRTTTGLENVMKDVLKGTPAGQSGSGGLGGARGNRTPEPINDPFGKPDQPVVAQSPWSTGGGAVNKGFGDLFNDALANGGEPSTAPSAQDELAAGLLLSAMIQAAKSDGRIDASEQKKLMDKLAGANAQEMQFVHDQLRAPIDIRGLCEKVPAGSEQMVYAVSLAAIDLDSQIEADYLRNLATELRLSAKDVADIHAQMGRQI